MELNGQLCADPPLTPFSVAVPLVKVTLLCALNADCMCRWRIEYTCDMCRVLIAGFVEVYLIDAVTGNVVFHCNHKRAKGPVSVIHAENWLVVSAYSAF